MGTITITEHQDCCYNGCKFMGACDGHEFQLTINTVCDIMEFKKDGKQKFIAEPDEFAMLLDLVKRADYASIEVK